MEHESTHAIGSRAKNRTSSRTKTPIYPLLLSSVITSVVLGACSSSDSGGVPSSDAGGEDIDIPGEVIETTFSVPGRSTTISLTTDDQRLVVVNRQNNSVSVIQVKDENGNDTETKIAEVTVGIEPRNVALTPDNSTAYVTNGDDGTVSVIDLSSAVPAIVGAPIPVGTEPRGISMTPNGRYALVANHTAGTVSVISTTTNSVVNTVEVGGNPMSVSISNDGDTDDRDETAYVTSFFSEVIDPENRPDGFNDSKRGVVDYFSVDESIASTPTVREYYIAPIADAGFAADRRRFCQETRNTLQAEGTVFFNSGPLADGDGAAALTSDLFCPDTASTDATAEGPIANTAQGAYPNQLFSSLLRGNELFVPNVGASPEPPVRFNLNIQALVATLNLSTGTAASTNINNQIKTETQPENETESLDRLFGSELVAIDADPEGNNFLLVSRGGNYVMRASQSTDGTLDISAPSAVVRFQTGNIPTGVVMSLDGSRAYTNNEVSTSVTAIDLDNNVVLQRDIDSSAPPELGTQKHRNILGKLAFYTALGIPDSLDDDDNGSYDIPIRSIQPLAFRGKASDNAWSSCASCHDDGHADNVTWIFPTGPRQTIPLEGTFSKVDPTDQRILNWNAVRGSVTDFNNNSRGVQGGTGHATDVDGVNKTAQVFNHGPTEGISDALDAMTEWVANTVSAPNMPDADVAAGRALFAENCVACHGGAKWTKSSVTLYQNNPTFAGNPLAANFFAGGREPALDPNLNVGGPQIVSVEGGTRFLDNVGTRDGANELEIRGAGAIGGGAISIAGDPNEGLEVAAQSTQGFASLGGAGFNSPSLLGVGYHAPYLHDGSAETLQEVFERHAASADDPELTIADSFRNIYGGGEVELEELEAFLLSIDDDTEPF